jgi:hypothetical protein
LITFKQVTTYECELVQWIYLLQIEVFIAISIFLEQLSRAMTKQFVVRDLHLEGLCFP